MNEDYFFRRTKGFEFTMPGVALSGPVTEDYSKEDHLWHVVHESGGQTYEGIGDSQVKAYLNLIAVRMGEA
jgi:hypothetical protein